MSLCQLHDPKLFGPSIHLLHSVIQILHRNELFKDIGISGYCIETRNGKLEPMLNKIDELSGLSFENNFSFAFVGHLLKGIRTSTTKTQSMRLLTDMMDLHGESNLSKILGFLAALFPLSGDDVASNLRQMYVYILI